MIRNSSQKDNIGTLILPFEIFIHFRHVNKILIDKVYLPGYVIIEAFLY